MADCPAKLVLYDDHGDNPCTFNCEMQEGHADPHIETGTIANSRSDVFYNNHFSIQWTTDEQTPSATVHDPNRPT